MPFRHLGQVGRHPVQDADDETRHHSEKGAVFAFAEHGQDRREAVDGVKIQQIDREGGTPANPRRRQQEEEGREMEVRNNHPRKGAEDFAQIIGEPVVARCRLAGVDEFFLAEDLDAGGGGDEADGDADEDGHEGHGVVVDAAREDGVGGQEEAAEVDAFGFELGEADEEAAEGGEEDFEEEGGAEPVLLQEGPDEAVVDLFVEGGAAGLDAAAEGECFGGFVVAVAVTVGGGVEGRGGWESRVGESRGIDEGVGAAGSAFTAESS